MCSSDLALLEVKLGEARFGDNRWVELTIPRETWEALDGPRSLIIGLAK